MRQGSPVQLLLVEDNEQHARRVIRLLGEAGPRKFKWRRARRLLDAQEHLAAGGTDLALLDLCLPDAQGIEVLQQAQRVAPEIPIIVLSGQANDSLAREVLQHGAQDFLLKRELDYRRLMRAVMYAIARHLAQSSLRTLSVIDELTGLHNRRGFVALAGQQLKLSDRRGLHSSLVFLDVDEMKRINDGFGHREGDRALRELAGMFRECCQRDSDIVARFGGDEFCALLTDTSESGEMLIRERLSHALDERNARPGCRYHLSVSVGIVAAEGSLELDHQLDRADAKMYAHKRKKNIRNAAAGQLGQHSLI